MTWTYVIVSLTLVGFWSWTLSAASRTDHLPEDFEIISIHTFNIPSEEEPLLTRRRKRRAEQNLYLNISSSEDTYSIQLTLNTDLLAPGFRIYHRHTGDDDERITEQEDVDNVTQTLDNCFYRGDVRSHDRAKAAISLCGGVTGILMLPHDDYVIEPLPVSLQTEEITPKGEKKTHMMYKRSQLPHHKIDNYEARQYPNLPKTLRDKDDGHANVTRRSKRASRNPRTVETLVVVDKDMYMKHGRDNVTTYVLSIFNIVSQLYQDSTLGYTVNIVLVGLVYLDGQEPGLYITHHADQTLNSFCQWQATIRGEKNNRHDHAVLLTGLDICSYRNAPCDTLGFAPIDGMCSELRSCIVNEDSGLSTAFTIAHEIGHNFGMYHDGDGNQCRETTGNIMSATLAAQGGIFHWSPCSRQYMKTFLKAVQSDCLSSTAGERAELKFPDRLPGEIFDADTQCKWQFGTHSKQCTFDFGKDPCQNLWCYKGGTMCETKFLPAAEGTACGSGMWCKHGRCSRFGKRSPTPIDGYWTEWSAWSQCSRSCGGGVKVRSRECNNPRPLYGGQSCQGKGQIHKQCNLLECGTSAVDPRDQQCREHSSEKFRGWYFKWKPYRKEHTSQEADDQCKLYCQADGYNFLYPVSREVIDGTPCNDYSDNICVLGKCMPVGCDLIVDSSARKDICGVCIGDNSTCKVVSNRFTIQPRKNTYFPVVVIPRGASSIVVKEDVISPNNYLALKNIYGQYHINGDWQLNDEGMYKVAGARFVYRRSYNMPESLRSDGPLTEDVVLEVLIQGENPGISYSFTLPRETRHAPDQSPRHNYNWSISITTCSQKCAEGEQIVTAHCHRNHGDEVDPAYCDPAHKPATGTFACNTDPCPPRWVTQPWGSCTRRCGGGRQKRKVLCMKKVSQTKDRKVSKKKCDPATKPVHKQECNTSECPPVWYHGQWSKCSVTCGRGSRDRKVVCRSRTSKGHVTLPDSMCEPQPRPKSRRGCREKACLDPTLQWVITAWSQCSSSCGTGVRKREMRCTKRNSSGRLRVTNHDRCKHLPKRNMAIEEDCELKPCSFLAEWYASPWSECSATCGSGRQTRLVHCIIESQSRLATGCDETSKPQEHRTCPTEPCPTLDPSCKDDFSWCQLVPKHNICDHQFYGVKCCRSCRRTRR